MSLFGFNLGLSAPFMGSLWAEIYGVKYLGSIKALTTALMVFSTAFGTALFGILIVLSQGSAVAPFIYTIF